jgi:sugar lactone lactonase YvrE
MRFPRRQNSVLNGIVMLFLAGMISEGALAQALPAREPVGKLELVAPIMGDQPAGIAVSGRGRIFVSFPRHDGDVAYAVGEVKDGRIGPFPNLQVNRAGSRALDALFSVQTLMVDTSDRLWMLDTGVTKVGEAPVSGGPKLVVVDLHTDHVVRVVPIPGDGLVLQSALKDFRIDFRRGREGTAFITDSAPGAEALIILDLATGKAVRRLVGAVQVRSMSDIIPIVGSHPLLVWPREGAPRPFAVGLNGLELSVDGKTLYFNAFTGRHLYAVATNALCDLAISNEELEHRIKLVGSIGIAGHLSIDSDGRLYVMDMEQNAVFRRAPDGRVETIVADPRLMWPDTLAIGPDQYLYVTSSQHDRRPQFHDGDDLRQRPFAVYRVFVGASPVRPGRSDE